LLNGCFLFWCLFCFGLDFGWFFFYFVFCHNRFFSF
jgi:hypothetical protein